RSLAVHGSGPAPAASVLPVVEPGASFELHEPAASVKLATHRCGPVITQTVPVTVPHQGSHRQQLRSGSFPPMRAQVTRRPWLGTSAGSVRAAGCGAWCLIRAS